MGSPTSPVTPYHYSPDSAQEPEEPVSPIIEDSPSAEHAVDLGKIQRGEDVRTTVRVSSSFTRLTSHLSDFYRS
jgi:hypothetical protein